MTEEIQAPQPDDGGPAFPSHGSMGEVVQLGMSLRDYFAAKVMQGLCANSKLVNPSKQIDNLARSSYEIADALIAAREAS